MRALRPVRRLRAPSRLLTQFALVSAIAVGILGVVLSHFFEAQIRKRTTEDATRSAVMLARTGIQPQLKPRDLTIGLGDDGLRTLQRQLASGQAEAGIERMKIWSRSNTIVYSDDASLIGLTFMPSENLRRALAGEVTAEVTNAGKAAETRSGGERLLDVHVPLHFAGSGMPAGVFELYLPFDPIERAIAADTRTMVLILLAGLALLWAALFRLAAGASRRLRRQAQENEYQALHDPLTDLPNRTLFRDRVEHAISIARRDGTLFAVMLMDLDRFKEINDTLGHHSGDVLLQEVATRLRAAVRDSDTVARLGGDEFAVLLRDVTPGFVAEVSQRIHHVLEQPVYVQDLIIDVEASIGVALFPEHGEEVETLIQRADVAMYAAKSSGDRCAVYDADQDDYNPARLALVGELRRAISERELILHFQPKATVESGEVSSVEALVRWQHPTRGLLPPVEFIPMAQRTGLIKPLTLYVIDAALAQVAEWQKTGLDLAVAVNLSVRSLHDTELVDDVTRLLCKWRLPASSLQLEITEDSIMADPPRARAVLRRLSAMGVRLAIDDFGTGYSSLGYLRSLPMSELKIDRSFVMNMDQDENDAVIVRSTIDLGRNLGLDVVAEGVESAAAWERLDHLGCDLVQGYYLSRPVPGDDLAAWLTARRATRLAS